MDDKAKIRRGREIDGRHPAEVMSMDPVVVCTRIYCAVTTLCLERRGAKERRLPREWRRVSRNRHEKYPGRVSRAERTSLVIVGTALRERDASPHLN